MYVAYRRHIWASTYKLNYVFITVSICEECKLRYINRDEDWDPKIKHVW